MDVWQLRDVCVFGGCLKKEGTNVWRLGVGLSRKNGFVNVLK